MISLPALAAFLPVAALLVAVPGPSVLFTIGRALTVGRRGALVTVLGNASGLVVQGTAIACGLGVLMASVAWALTALKVGGGLYLIWLGVDAVRHRRAGVTGETQPDARPAVADLRTGFVLGVTNPKTLVFLTALLPQFVPADASPTAQMEALALAFAVVALLGDSVWALTAAQARAWFGRSPGRLVALRGSGGVLLVGLGAWTLASRTV